MLFFTAPPVIPDQAEDGVRGHSVRYLAAKARREEAQAQKRKQVLLERQASERVAKKARVEEGERTREDVQELQRRALRSLEAQLAQNVEGELDESDLARLVEVQRREAERNGVVLAHERMRSEGRKVVLSGNGFADDWDNRVS